MENLFCPYEQALALKELGFDYICLGSYTNEDDLNIGDGFYYKTTPCNPNFCIAPLYQQAFKWFRDRHKLMASVDISDEGTEYEHYFVSITTIGMYGEFVTYEEAELECIKKLIELVKN